MQLKKQHIKGAALAYFEQGEAAPSKPTLLFVHATGFHGRIWDMIIASFPDFHVIALEQRGHGRSDKLAVTDWKTFGRDQAEFVSALDLNHIIGIGHSMGGHSMIDAAAISQRFARLLLLDPTVASPDTYTSPEPIEWDQLHPAAKRRNQFATSDEMFEQLRNKSSFPLFDPQILRDYCEFGLEESASGGLELCCQPEIEAHVYMSARSNGSVYDSVHALEIPVTVVRAKLPINQAHDFSSSPTWPGLSGQFSNARDIHFADCSHFIPMQKPDAVIDIIKEEISAWRRK